MRPVASASVRRASSSALPFFRGNRAMSVVLRGFDCEDPVGAAVDGRHHLFRGETLADVVFGGGERRKANAPALEERPEPAGAHLFMYRLNRTGFQSGNGWCRKMGSDHAT